MFPLDGSERSEFGFGILLLLLFAIVSFLIECRRVDLICNETTSVIMIMYVLVSTQIKIKELKIFLILNPV